MDLDRLVTGLQEVTSAFAGTVAGLDPQATVPTCPEWRVRDLVGHLGQAYRWSAGLVRSRAAAPPPDPRDAEPGHPQHWPTWLHDSAADLVGAITDTGPETDVWTFVGEQPARFWLRRMLADSTVHLADAAFAAGRAFTISPDLAAETIDEGLGLISSAGAAGLKPGLGELRGHGQTLQLRPTDVEPGWLITREPGDVGAPDGRRGRGRRRAGERSAAGVLPADPARQHAGHDQRRPGAHRPLVGPHGVLTTRTGRGSWRSSLPM
jgi:uncharacterized protein (TIGR03083 family)